MAAEYLTSPTVSLLQDLSTSCVVLRSCFGPSLRVTVKYFAGGYCTLPTQFLKTFLGHICSSPESYGVTHSYATKSAIRLNISRSTPASMRRKTFMLLQELAEQCSRPKYLIGFIVCHETVAHATI